MGWIWLIGWLGGSFGDCVYVSVGVVVCALWVSAAKGFSVTSVFGYCWVVMQVVLFCVLGVGYLVVCALVVISGGFRVVAYFGFA